MARNDVPLPKKIWMTRQMLVIYLVLKEEINDLRVSVFLVDDVILARDLLYTDNILRLFDGVISWVCVLAPVACDQGNTYISPGIVISFVVH